MIHLIDLTYSLYSEHDLLKEMWPEGAQAVTEVTKRPKSAGTRFKESMISLVENLKTKDPFYVRCIKPNEHKSPVKFDDERCLHQVQSGVSQPESKVIPSLVLCAGKISGSAGERSCQKSWLCKQTTI